MSTLGSRVRRLRESSGKSLRGLAADLRISPSALSTLENGHGGVSLQRLQRLADHFGLSVVDLLADVPSPPTKVPQIEVIPSALVVTDSLERGNNVFYQLPAASPKRLLQPALVSFGPGGGFANDKIGHVGEEVVYVLLGQVELHLGEEKHVLSQGDLAIFRSETAHGFRNSSEQAPAVLISVASPPW